MEQITDRMKRSISFLLVCALVFSAVQAFTIEPVSAAKRKKLHGAAIQYLPSADISTAAGITTTGGSIVVSGPAFTMIGDETDTDNETDTDGDAEEAIIATGAAVSLQCGLPAEFSIGENGAPAMFQIHNSSQMGICYQFRVITSAENGFQAWLVDGEDNSLISRADALGGSNVWRQSLEDGHTYYLVLTGDAGCGGKLYLSDILDDYGSELNKASVVALNQEYSIETEIADDVDVMAFTASKEISTYQIQIESVQGTGGTYELCDSAGKRLSEYCGEMKEEKRITKAFNPTPGARYHFRFTSQETGRKIVFKVTQKTTKYKVTYHLNGGTNAKGNPSTYVSTLTKFKLKNPTREKYSFDGWYLDSAYRTKTIYIQGSTRKNLDLYAKWTSAVPATTTITSLKYKKKGKVKAKWEEVSIAKKYQLVYGTTRSLKKNTKKKTLKKTSLTVKKLQEGVVYYFKVRSFGKDSLGKKRYSPYSKVKKIKVAPKRKAKKKAAQTQNV